MMISTFKMAVTDIAPELTSRPIGSQAREKLIQALKDYESIEVDFLDKSLTPSFADECIGQLAAAIGLNEFKKRVKLTHLNESSKTLVKHVILTRCSAVHP